MSATATVAVVVVVRLIYSWIYAYTVMLDTSEQIIFSLFFTSNGFHIICSAMDSATVSAAAAAAADNVIGFAAVAISSCLDRKHTIQ